MTINTKHFKKLLDEEEKALRIEIKSVSKPDPSHKGNWDAVPEKLDTDKADDDEVADRLESFEENQVFLSRFETRLLEITAALEKIKDGTYGACSVCGKEIENERLEANPAASTCMACMDK